MTTVLNSSFESTPFDTSWSNSSNSTGDSYTESTLQGVTDGSSAMKIAFDGGARSAGAYAYITQSIAFDGDSLLTFDYYDSAASVYSIAVLVDNVIYREIQLGSWGQHSDITAVLNAGSGTKTLKLGLLLKSNSSSGADITIDNLRIADWTAEIRYVKTAGDDTKDGTTWTNAWKTINKAATTVTDGATVHIGHGTYNSEPAGNTITPVNAGAIGIKYKPETADTGAEVAGSVTIEKN
jgi:hypothetical protein